MARRDNQLITYLSDSEMAQFKEWAAETEKSESQLLREAVLEYLDHDRAARIESELTEMREQIDAIQEAVSDEDTHTHKRERTTKASETVEKTRQIADRLRSNHEGVLDQRVVDRAIKDIAGGDPRTVEKYQTELKDRGHAYQHANDDLARWYVDREMFLNDLAGYLQQFQNPQAKAMRVLDDYPIEMPEAADCSERFNQEVVTE